MLQLQPLVDDVTVISKFAWVGINKPVVVPLSRIDFIRSAT
jgi:hypothetical protein